MSDDTLFGRIAVEEGFLTQAQLDQATLDRNGGNLPDLLVGRGLLTPPQVQTIRDIQRIHMAEASAANESGGQLFDQRFLLPCAGCDTYYLVQGFPEGTKFVCRKCQKVLTVRRVPEHEPPRPASAGGRVLGPFEILGEIGRGSMSVVYKARRRDTGQVLALKVMKESDTPNPRQLKRFEQEARAASRLSHPNIVRVHEAGEVEGSYYIAMDYVEGTTLQRALAERKIRLREFVAALEQVALAVHHAHQQGIIHRDLKPANIVLDAAGRPHVTDFGLAKMDHTEKSASTGGGSLGTPFYMSPEQVEGDVTGTDARSDIYALGVILYEALTGRFPYPGTSVMEVYRGVLAGKAARPRTVNPAAPPALEALCLRALERDKNLRPPSAREFADELRRALEVKW